LCQPHTITSTAPHMSFEEKRVEGHYQNKLQRGRM
jgi:hypothetical protein